MVDLPALIKSTLEGDKRSFDAVMMVTASARKAKSVVEVLPKELPLTVLTSQSKIKNSLTDAGIETTKMEEHLSAQGLGVLNHVHDFILQGMGEGRISRGERLLVVLAEPVEGVIVIDTNVLSTNRLANISSEFHIELAILTKLMELARHIGSRGREGHAVGALFAIGPLPSLRKYSTALVLNPFKGHPTEKRDIGDHANHESMAEFAWLDGAILFNREGIASDAGRYIQVPAGVVPKPGEGGRHLAARAISQLAECIAICVSSNGSITLYANGRDRYKVKLS